MVMHSAPPPQVGFNNNVRYRGMRFHIQTEDSGIARPHILTHLFADGGHVIKSLRTDYSEYVDHPDRTAMIQRMMRDQHRAMAIDLRDGRLDATIDRLRALTADSDAPTETVKFPEPQAVEKTSTPPTVVAKRVSDPPPAREEARRSRPPPSAGRRARPPPPSLRPSTKAAAPWAAPPPSWRASPAPKTSSAPCPRSRWTT
jgi:hypothetical protein